MRPTRLPKLRLSGGPALVRLCSSNPKASADHKSAVQVEFQKQASAGFDFRWHERGNSTQVLPWILYQLPPISPRTTVLDVATGTGIMARAIAPKTGMVIGVDITEGMLEEARKMAAAQSLSNVRFETGDADNLKYGDESFWLVTCRLAVHHFLNPQRPLAEMKRVVRRGGHVVVVDILAPDDEATHERYDNIERLRDPTHTRTQTKQGLQRLLMDSGLESHGKPITRLFPVKLTEWMSFTNTPTNHQQKILAAIEAELGGGPATGMRPYRVDDHLFFKHEYAVAIATRSLSRKA